ncbi:MAG: hypothetical protein Q7K65_05670 [Candidatus Buchananbacteria bacterium]|nr:hypothetical protein [Candidatus Buchananbacteria bacterium]
MITIVVFYYLYLVIVLFFVIYSFFNIYHLIRFGFASFTNIIIIVAYLIAATFLIAYSFILLNQVDWSLPLINLPVGQLGGSDINI